MVAIISIASHADNDDEDVDIEDFEPRLFRTTFANETVWITKNYLFGIDFEASVLLTLSDFVEFSGSLT